MKKRLHDKKAGVAILLSLIILALAEVVFRGVFSGGTVIVTANLGEQLSTIAFATIILILTALGKDRACYICYGGWLGYFALDQLFELPGVLIDVVNLSAKGAGFVALSPAFHVLSMICILVIGILLVEYMNDGTIYNRAYNTFCILAVLAILGAIAVNVVSVIKGQNITVLLASFHNAHRLIMIFMFTFFAYDSAKAQLKKTNLTK